MSKVNCTQGNSRSRQLIGQRNVTIDLVKGLGIIMMVFRHGGGPFSEIINLFHMALFFIASGYLFNCDRVKSIKDLCKYILGKLKRLWLPYVGFSSAFDILNNVFIRLNIYTDNPLYLEKYSGNYPMLASYLTFPEMIKKILRLSLEFQGTPQVGGGTVVPEYSVFPICRICSD